jgi:sec-independent protein translocase protein TatA
MSLGITEIILIVIVVILLFGGKRIPELAKGLGRAQYEYKKAKELVENEVKKLDRAEPDKVIEAAPKKRRGRPAKAAVAAKIQTEKKPVKRGRPAKAAVQVKDTVKGTKKRGRPSKKSA